MSCYFASLWLVYWHNVFLCYMTNTFVLSTYWHEFKVEFDFRLDVPVYCSLLCMFTWNTRKVMNVWMLFMLLMVDVTSELWQFALQHQTISIQPMIVNRPHISPKQVACFSKHSYMHGHGAEVGIDKLDCIIIGYERNASYTYRLNLDCYWSC